MSRKKTYNLARVIMTVNGVPMSGFGESDAANWEPNSDIWETTVGADGELTRNKTNDDSGKLTFTFSKMSMSNGVLNVFLQLAKNFGIGDTFTIMINDLNGGDKLIAIDCYIEREPDLAFGKAAGEKAWVIKTPSGKTSHGGSLI